MKPESGPDGLRFVRCGLIFLTLTATLLRAQELPPPVNGLTSPTADGPPVTVHGTIVNAATGQPVSGALVKIDSQQLGALSDGEGHFSLAGVFSGLQSFDVIKPGFHPPGKSFEGEMETTLTVRVTANTPALVFSLAPENSISGHVTLAPGVPAKHIGVVLIEQVNSNGRAAWRKSEQHQSTSAGEFRFSGLEDGTYLLMTEPEFENSVVDEPSCNADSPGEMDGYDSSFYRGSGSLASAARIVVSGSQNAETDLSVNETKFYLTQVSIQDAPAGDGWMFNRVLSDHSGQEVRYPIHEEKNHTVCAYLPEGSYTLVEDGSPEQRRPVAGQEPQGAGSSQRVGVLEFRVGRDSGRGFRMQLSEGASTPVYVHYQPGAPKPREPPTFQPTVQLREEFISQPQPLSLGASGASPFSDSGSNELEANRINDTTYAFDPAPPGAYWIHGEAGTPGTCLGQVTAAGQDLAQSPWVVGAGGTGAPIEVVLRTDCATLNFSMPPALPAESAGEGTSIFLYAVPEFSSVGGVSFAQLQQYGDRNQKLEDITPGTYRVFAFRTPHSLEYHNAAALAQLGTGQEITLEAGGSATLVVQEILP
jgi:hypothetical protein